MWLPASGTPICARDALADKPARSFILRDPQDSENQLDIIVWRDGEDVAAFVNQCPHLKVPLETFPDRLLNSAGSALICSAHGAQFNRQGGCFVGPCEGDALTRVAIETRSAKADEGYEVGRKIIVFAGVLSHS
jgi:nitrite reductase/ring-hydroxylating ferredoxin subunit